TVARAQSSSSSTQTSSSSQTTQQPQQKKPTQPATGEAGGPGGDIGPMAIPKKPKEEEAPRPKPKITAAPDYTITKDVGLVQLDVLVTTKQGQFIPGL